MLKKKDNVKTEDKDSVGGGFTFKSDVYDVLIELAYIEKTPKGSIMIQLHLKNEDGAVFKAGNCVRSGDEKGNSTTYKDKEGNEHYLPDYNTMDALCQLITDGELNDLDTEEKVINRWDTKEGKEMPTKTNIIPVLMGKRVKVAVLETIENKYKSTTDVVHQNVIKKFFDSETGRTLTEITAEAEAVFINTWREKFKGTCVDNSTNKGGKGSTDGAPTKTKTTDKLFG